MSKKRDLAFVAAGTAYVLGMSKVMPVILKLLGAKEGGVRPAWEPPPPPPPTPTYTLLVSVKNLLGQAIVGAFVKATNTATLSATSALTNSLGLAALVLPAATYRVDVQATGYPTPLPQNVTLDTNKTLYFVLGTF